MIEIKCRFSGRVLFSHEGPTIKVAVEAAVKARANLTSANLTYADLTYADLRSANLTYADLRSANLTYADLTYADLRSAVLRSADLNEATVLTTGESWLDFKSQVVPALLTAGGKALESFAESWQCHSWDNCPMHHAFNAGGLSGVPILLRPRAEQFIQFFDAGLIPCPASPPDVSVAA